MLQLFVLVAIAAEAFAVPAVDVISSRQVQSPYAPHSAVCPSTALVRPAQSINALESAYVNARKPIASKALAQWLSKTDTDFGTPNSYPVLGLTTSGGGYRSLLCGAGVHQGFDSREGNISTSGLYQALTYEAGLSGGSWLLSSISANNWPTISSLQQNLWTQAFEYGLAAPGGPSAAPVNLAQVGDDIAAKQNAGFNATLTDPWARLLSYQLLYGSDGGVSKQISNLVKLPNYKKKAVPFPIITALGVKTDQGDCLPGPNATQYEFTPYEFGSWDQGVQAFVNIRYLGSNLTNGKPASKKKCVTNYDNQGYILGTSSNLFNEVCTTVPDGSLISNASLVSTLEGLLGSGHQTSTQDEYAMYPNPFKGLSNSPLVAGETDLTLVDGGEALQNNPIWPFLNRDLDVLIVNDNSADTSTNFPNGSEILTTYVQSVSAGLTRMPVIPDVDTFLAEGLSQNPTFFGCDDDTKMTIIYIPNMAWIYPSNQSTSKLQYEPDETAGMISNGNQIANYNGTSGWATCLGCGIMKKTGASLPSACGSCFEQYCYN